MYSTRHGNKTSLCLFQLPCLRLLSCVPHFLVLSLFALIALGTGENDNNVQILLSLTICQWRTIPLSFLRCCIFAQIAVLVGWCSIIVGCLHNRVVILVHIPTALLDLRAHSSSTCLDFPTSLYAFKLRLQLSKRGRKISAVLEP